MFAEPPLPSSSSGFETLKSSSRPRASHHGGHLEVEVGPLLLGRGRGFRGDDGDDLGFGLPRRLEGLSERPEILLRRPQHLLAPLLPPPGVVSSEDEDGSSLSLSLFVLRGNENEEEEEEEKRKI